MGDWNVGMGGAVGLRSEAFREVRYSLGVRRDEWPQILEDVRVMERAALDYMAERRQLAEMMMRKGGHG